MLTIVIVTTLDLKEHIAKPTLTNVLPILVPTTPLASTKLMISIVIVMKVTMVRTVLMISQNAKKTHVKILDNVLKNPTALFIHLILLNPYLLIYKMFSDKFSLMKMLLVMFVIVCQDMKVCVSIRIWIINNVILVFCLYLYN